jgi:hypothetical protein
VYCAQVPALNIFESSLRRGKFDDSRKLSDGSLMEFTHIYPMDAVYDTPEDVPQDVSASVGQHGSGALSGSCCQELLVTAAQCEAPSGRRQRCGLPAHDSTAHVAAGTRQQAVCGR